MNTGIAITMTLNNVITLNIYGPTLCARALEYSPAYPIIEQHFGNSPIPCNDNGI